MDEYIENRIAAGPEPAEMEAIGHCPQCGEPIYVGDELAVLPDLDVCAHFECYEEYLLRRGLLIIVADKEDAERLQEV